MNTINRWRGLKALAQDAVHNASCAIERLQKETTRRPYAILEQIPPIAEPARGIHLIHDAILSTVHGTIRETTRVIGGTIDVVLDAMTS